MIYLLTAIGLSPGCSREAAQQTKISTVWAVASLRRSTINAVPVFAMEAEGERKCKFTHSTLDCDEWSASLPDRFNQGEGSRE